MITVHFVEPNIYDVTNPAENFMRKVHVLPQKGEVIKFSDKPYNHIVTEISHVIGPLRGGAGDHDIDITIKRF